MVVAYVNYVSYKLNHVTIGSLYLFIFDIGNFGYKNLHSD